MDTGFANETAYAPRDQMLTQAGTVMIKNSASAMRLTTSLIE